MVINAETKKLNICNCSGYQAINIVSTKNNKIF
jgi:hypothetical protein